MAINLNHKLVDECLPFLIRSKQARTMLAQVQPDTLGYFPGYFQPLEKPTNWRKREFSQAQKGENGATEVAAGLGFELLGRTW